MLIIISLSAMTSPLSNLEDTIQMPVLAAWYGFKQSSFSYSRQCLPLHQRKKTAQLDCSFVCQPCLLCLMIS